METNKICELEKLSAILTNLSSSYEVLSKTHQLHEASAIMGLINNIIKEIQDLKNQK